MTEAASFLAIHSYSVLRLLLWVLFGYVVSHIDCNIQHKLVDYPFVGYVTMFVCCYFLFVAPSSFGRLQDAVTDPEPEPEPKPKNVMALLGQSVYVFVFMVIWLKCRWDFSFVVLIIMVLENFIKSHYLVKQPRDEKKEDARIAQRIRDVSLASNVLCFILLGIGLALKIRESIMMNKDKRLTANFFRLFVCR